MDKKKNILIGAAVAVLLLIGGGAYVFIARPGFIFKSPKLVVIDKAAAKGKIEDFVKNGLGIPPGMEVAVSDATEEGGVYKAIVTVQQKDYPMYLSLDGKKFFPNALDAEAIQKPEASADQPSAQEVPKSAKPEVRLFVMSYCPYGMQIEKGILPVLAALGNKIDFKLEFVSYSMHDKKELDENLRQYCIREQDPSRLGAYLDCFLKKGQGTEAACLKTAGVNAAKNAACASAADEKFGVTKNYGDKSTYQGNFPTFNVDKEDNDKYAVQGSPTLVINGVTADSQRDPASLLKTVCSGFENAPKECEKTLSTTAPAPGSGTGTAGSASAGNCGN